MADLESLLLFVRYDNEFERSECVVLPRRNPFQEYNEEKFRQRFRLSKFAVTKLLDEVHCKTLYILSANSFCSVQGPVHWFCPRSVLSNGCVNIEYLKRAVN